MRPGDIHTHFYARGTPQLDAQKKLQPYMLEARKRGVLFDVGHGGGSFWFRIAVPAIRQGFLPDTISTDLHKRSIMLPTLHDDERDVEVSGDGHDARSGDRTQYGQSGQGDPASGSWLGIDEGGVADIAVLEVRKGQFALLDSGHAKLTTDKEIRCVLTVRNGKIVWDSEGLSLTDWRDAGPYSNFK